MADGGEARPAEVRPAEVRPADEVRPVEVPVGYVVGRWRVTGYLGSGSWGSVYSGERIEDAEPRDEDPHDEEPQQVALKFLPPPGTPGHRTLLADVVERERRFSARVDHPAIIRTFAVETASGDPVDGATVLIMERAVGNVRELLNGRPVPEAPRILAEVCNALAYMHEAGWIHGDVKPGNVLLTADGGVRLADFGVTAQLDGTHAYTPRLGSFDYLPPEWWSEQVGEQGIASRPTADVWAFGILAHQLLTGGRHPFAGASAQARAMNAQTYARSGEGLLLDEQISAPWRALIRDCLTPDHVGRAAFPARGLVERIKELMAESGDDAERETERGGAGARHRLLVPGVLAIVTTLVALATFVVGLRWGSNSKASAGAGPAGAGSAATTAAKTATAAATNTATTATTAATTPRGELRPDAAVPAQYRDAIRHAAHACPAPEVTPALIAGVLKVESDFNPNFSDPATESYGIAGWTPRVFRAWAPRPGADYMNPTDAITAAGQYLCWLDEQFAQAGLPGDLAALTVAGYDTNTKSVLYARGVPSDAADFTKAVLDHAREYSQ